MRSSRNSVIAAFAAATLLLVATNAPAQQAGRIAGTVVDPDGNPIPGVTITISAVNLDRETVKTTDKKGRFVVSHADAAMTYEYRFEKEGYVTQRLPVNPPVGGTEVKEFVLLPRRAVEKQPTDTSAPPPDSGRGGNPAIRTYNEGVEAQRLGDLVLAEEKYREAAELDPQLASAHTSLAALSLQNEDYESAAAEAEAALSMDSGDVRALQIRFDAYRLAGNEEMADEAANALRQIGDLGDAAARIFNEGVDAHAAGDIATAQSKFQQVIQLDPTLVAPYLALAQISLSHGSPAEAAAMAHSALELEPDNIRALKIAFDGARLAGDMGGAEQALGRLAELDPGWITTTLFDHATKLFNENKPAEASVELEYVVKADPELARARFLLGMALFNSDRADEGRAQLQKFIELAPDDPDAEIARGLLSYQE